MSKADLSRALNIPASTISSWTKYSDGISLVTLQKIANYFSITLEELVNGSTLKGVTFTMEDFTTEELNIIVSFSKFLIKSRCK